MKFFNKLNIHTRIIYIFSIIILCYVGNIIYNIHNLNNIKKNVQTIYETRLKSIAFLLEADRDSYQSKLAISESIALLVLQQKDSVVIPDHHTLEMKISQINDNLGQIKMRFGKFEKLFLSTGGINEKWFAVFNTNYVEVSKHTQSLTSTIQQEDYQTAQSIYFHSYNTNYEEMRNAIDQLTEITYAFTEQEYQRSIKDANQIRTFTLVIFSLVLILLIIFGIILTRSITYQLGCEPSEIAFFAKELSKGNLHVSIDKEDKYGAFHSLVLMKERICEVLKEINMASDTLAETSVILSQGSQSVSQSVQEMAASTEEISSTVQEISANIQENTRTAKITENKSIEASKEITQGNEAVKNTLKTLEVIVEKINVITEISRQTNILAINAAIEASQAGDHGGGFAVISQEVRKLSEHTSQAAHEITALTSNSLEVAQKSTEILEDIVPNIKSTADLIQNIAVSSQHQSEGTTQIDHAIQQLNNVVQHNAANSEKMANNSTQLAQQAQKLKQMIAFFKTKKTV